MKILYLEGERLWHDALREGLGNGFCVLSAFTLNEARRLFVNHSDIDLVVVGEKIERELDTLEFVVEIRRGFSGTILAACTNCNNGQELIKAGCNSQSIKSHLAEAVVRSIGQPAMV
jgi:hypothetical protein